METAKNFPDHTPANPSDICPPQAMHEITDDTAKKSAAHKTKKEIRTYHKKLRDAMPEYEVLDKSREICKKVLAMEAYQRADILYAYYPLGNEVSCLPIIRHALLEGKRAALPRVLGGKDKQMDFYQIHALDHVQEGTFHVMEPQQNCPILTAEHAFVLVPGVVFDRSGNRYGYGKGYYDRYFARFPHLHRVALAYENQLEDYLKTLHTDVKMEDIITEKSVYHIFDHASP